MARMGAERARRGRVLVPLVGVLLLALLVRLAFFLEVRDDPRFTVPLWDSAVFDEMARSIARGDGSGDPRAYYFGPLYAYVLGAIYAVSDRCAACAVALQHAVGVAIGALVYVLARTWFGRGTSLLAAAIFCLNGLQIFHEGKLLMEVWVSALLLLFVLFLTRYDRTEAAAGSERVPLLGLAGLALGLAALGRPTVLLLAPLVLLPSVGKGRWPLRRWPLRRWPARRGTDPASAPLVPCSRQPGGRSGAAVATSLAVFLLALALPIAVTAVRNFRVEGVWVPITASGGFNFYLGNAREAEGHLGDLAIRLDSSWNGEGSAEAALGRDLDSAELSRYWLSRTLAELRNAPFAWLGRLAAKFQQFLGGQDVPQIEVFALERERSWVLRLLPSGLHLLMAAALAGMALTAPRAGSLRLLHGTVLLYALGIALFFVTTRYRVAVLPFLSVFAAAFLVAVGEAGRRRSWRRLLLLVPLGFGAWGLTHPARFPVDAPKELYTLLLHDGFRLTQAKEFSQAVIAYEEAQRVLPADYEAHLGLGITYREQGDLAASLRALEEAMVRNQADAEVPYHLGVTLQKMRLAEGAEQALRRSLELDPRRALTHAHLGVVLATLGRYDEAEAAFGASLALDAHEPFTHNNQGVLRGLRGDHAGARAAFVRALEADPSYASARRNLAQSYLESGETAAAVRELETILAHEPENDAAATLLRTIRAGGSR